MYDQVLENKDLEEEDINVLELSIELTKPHEKREVESATFGVFMLIVSLCAAILNLPSFLRIEAKSICLRIAWRYMVLFLIFIPKMAFDAYIDVFHFAESVASYTGPIFGLALLNTAYAYMVYFAAERTFVVHTLLLSSIATTFLSTWKIASKQRFTRFEYIGIGINVFGAYLCCCEGAPIASKKRRCKRVGSSILVGNLCAIASSAVFAMYSTYSNDLIQVKKCPLSVFFALLSGFSVILSYIISQVLGEGIQLVSTDPLVGFFGLASSQYA